MYMIRLERSTDQVIKPINIEALSKWVGHIPPDVVKNMHKIAPMLAVFGYDPFANPPDYGKPDTFVQNKMKEIEQNKDEWTAKEKEMMLMRESIRNNLLKQKSDNKVSNNDIVDGLQLQSNDLEKTKTSDHESGTS